MGKGDVDAAEKAFTRAVKADPSNRIYAADLQIASQHRVTKLIQDADKARLTGQPDVARAKLAEILDITGENEFGPDSTTEAVLARPFHSTAGTAS